MKKLVIVGVAVLLVVGLVKLVSGKSPEAQARKACENVAEQCGSLARLGGDKLTPKDIDECSKELAEAKKDLGDSYQPMMTCMADASTCGEALGCVGGAVFNEIGDKIGKELEGMGRGFQRMKK